MNSTDACSPDKTLQTGLDVARSWLAEDRAVLVGIGAGLSASAGLNYTDPVFFQDHYAPFAELGFRTIGDAIRHFWDMTEANLTAYRGFWAWHIRTIHDAPAATAPYKNLAALLAGRNYFLLTTNADGQIHKVGLDEERLFLPQGEYGLMQCPLPCHEAAYANKAAVDAILRNLDGNLRADKADIPVCPRCGRFLVPNLRKDDYFVDQLYREGYPRCRDWLDRNLDASALLLELGVGFNTPDIIRYPFEKMAADHPSLRLIRVNLEHAAVPPRLGSGAAGIKMDNGAFLAALAGNDAHGRKQPCT